LTVLDNEMHLDIKGELVCLEVNTLWKLIDPLDIQLKGIEEDVKNWDIKKIASSTFVMGKTVERERKTFLPITNVEEAYYCLQTPILLPMALAF